LRVPDRIVRAAPVAAGGRRWPWVAVGGRRPPTVCRRIRELRSSRTSAA